MAIALIRNNNNLETEDSLIDEQSQNVGGVMLLYSSARQYSYNHTAAEGSLIQFLVETHTNSQNSFSDKGHSSVIQLEHNFNLGKAHSLEMRYTQAKRDAVLQAYRLGSATHPQNIAFNKLFYGFPGYQQGAPELITHRFRLLAVDYTLPITQNSVGLLAPPVGFGNNYLQASLQSAFIDQPLLSNENEVYSSIGLSFNTDLSFGLGLINLPAKLYYARGLDTNIGITEAGFQLQQLF